MLPRRALPTLHRLARGFPIVAITGPRQSGKTTLARQAFPALPYVNLEDLDTRELALADPRLLVVADRRENVPARLKSP